MCSYERVSTSQRGDINSLRPRPNRRHFAADIFKCISLIESASIPIKFSLKFVPRGPISNIPALVQIMAWRRPGDKPLSEPMMDSLPTHICVTRPQWVKNSQQWFEKHFKLIRVFLYTCGKIKLLLYYWDSWVTTQHVGLHDHLRADFRRNVKWCGEIMLDASIGLEGGRLIHYILSHIYMMNPILIPISL